MFANDPADCLSLFPQFKKFEKRSILHCDCRKGFLCMNYDGLLLMLLRIFILLSPDSVRRELLDNPYTFHCNDNFVRGGIRTCLGVSSSDRMFVWISSNSCPLNLLLVQSHPAKIIIAKLLIQGCNYVTRVGVEPRS